MRLVGSINRIRYPRQSSANYRGSPDRLFLFLFLFVFLFVSALLFLVLFVLVVFLFVVTTIDQARDPADRRDFFLANPAIPAHGFGPPL
jgi:hypothetical protein